MKQSSTSKILISFSMVNFSEIGCGTNTDCPNQMACINALCIDPCAHANVCTQHQECQVTDHQMVCIQGEFLIWLKICIECDER